jgi:uncharacterized membrane protein (DUF2068 family)
VIIAYKLAKALVEFALAAILTFWPSLVASLDSELAHELSEWGAAGLHLSEWVRTQLTAQLELRAALLAVLDGAFTLLEGLLLASGKAWAEWLVMLGLAALLPFEAE